MAKVRKKDKESVKWKKKRWYPILAPNILNSQVLGETSTFEPVKVIGKTLNVNLMNLTGEVRNQNVKVGFRVSGVKEGRAMTEVTGYTLSPSFIKRVVRRRHTRIDSNFTLKTKNSHKIIIKPLLITRNNVNRSVATAIRHGAREVLNGIVSSHSSDEFFMDLIHYKVQNELKKRLSRIYPMKTCEIKSMALLPTKEGS